MRTPKSPINLRQSIVMKTSFRTRVSRMGLDSFVEIDFEILSYLVFF